MYTIISFHHKHTLQVSIFYNENIVEILFSIIPSLLVRMIGNQMVMSRGSLLSVTEQNKRGTSVPQVRGIPSPAQHNHSWYNYISPLSIVDQLLAINALNLS